MNVDADRGLSGEVARYIPFRRRDIEEMLLAEGSLADEGARDEFRRLCRMVACVFHFEFHDVLERLKDAYYPFDPDVTRARAFSAEALGAAREELFSGLETVLNSANYDAVSRAEIERAFRTSGLLPVNVKIDLDDFESFGVYARGSRRERVERSAWFGLRRRSTECEILERVVFVVRFRGPEYFERRRRRDLHFVPGSMAVKMFKDVPREDLEILFPNARVSMGLRDKLVLGIPAVAGGVPLLLTKVLPALITVFVVLGAYLGARGQVEADQMKQAIAAISALAALVAFVLRQLMKYKNLRYEFQKRLSENLYFRNLVNNVGVLRSLIDDAEEEECKEAILAYHFLRATGSGLTERELDETIERWFALRHGTRLDFECPDALAKLERLGLLKRDADGRLAVAPMGEALRLLDERWDNYFLYANPAAVK